MASIKVEGKCVVENNTTWNNIGGVGLGCGDDIIEINDILCSDNGIYGTIVKIFPCLRGRVYTKQ